jgi:hypothetical protein
VSKPWLEPRLIWACFCATWVPAVVAGLAGFAFGLVASADILGMRAAWLWLGGTISTDTVWMFVIGLPVLLVGTWLGVRRYGRLDEAGFRKLILPSCSCRESLLLYAMCRCVQERYVCFRQP